MKKVAVIAVILVGIIAVIIGIYLVLPDDTKQSLVESLFSDAPACDGGPYFTSVPIDTQYLRSSIPLGNLNPSGHTFPTDHIYFNFTDDAQDIPVYAPGDVTVTTISSSENLWANPPFTDYSINFRVCEDIEAYYIHVHDLSPTLAQAFAEHADEDCDTYETGGRTFRNCWAEVEVPVGAGELVAHTARAGQTNFDMGLYDYSRDAQAMANPARWEAGRDSYLYTRCPIDYYTTDIKQTLAATFGDWGDDPEIQPRTIEPVCGTIAQDVPGTAAGIWFLATETDTPTREDPHLALVHDNIDPTLGTHSIGTSLAELGIPSGVYYYQPTHSGAYNREISEVTPGQTVYCYDGYGGAVTDFTDRAILIQLADRRTLRMGPAPDSSCGDGPWELGAYREFVR